MEGATLTAGGLIKAAALNVVPESPAMNTVKSRKEIRDRVKKKINREEDAADPYIGII